MRHFPLIPFFQNFSSFPSESLPCRIPPLRLCLTFLRFSFFRISLPFLLNLFLQNPFPQNSSSLYSLYSVSESSPQNSFHFSLNTLESLCFSPLPPESFPLDIPRHKSCLTFHTLLWIPPFRHLSSQNSFSPFDALLIFVFSHSKSFIRPSHYVNRVISVFAKHRERGETGKKPRSLAEMNKAGYVAYIRCSFSICCCLPSCLYK